MSKLCAQFLPQALLVSLSHWWKKQGCEIWKHSDIPREKVLIICFCQFHEMLGSKDEKKQKVLYKKQTMVIGSSFSHQLRLSSPSIINPLTWRSQKNLSIVPYLRGKENGCSQPSEWASDLLGFQKLLKTKPVRRGFEAWISISIYQLYVLLNFCGFFKQIFY